jgi:hypothetical protein
MVQKVIVQYSGSSVQACAGIRGKWQSQSRWLLHVCLALVGLYCAWSLLISANSYTSVLSLMEATSVRSDVLHESRAKKERNRKL